MCLYHDLLEGLDVKSSMTFFRFILLKWPIYSRVPYTLSSKQADVFALFFFKYNNKHVFCPSSATENIPGSSSWKVIHLNLGSQISNLAASHLASGASHQLGWEGDRK